MAYKSRVSDAVVRRLPMYYRHLRELEKAGVVRISSQELGERMNLTASQIRQDINCFGGFGQQFVLAVHPLHEDLRGRASGAVLDEQQVARVDRKFSFQGRREVFEHLLRRGEADVDLAVGVADRSDRVFHVVGTRRAAPVADAVVAVVEVEAVSGDVGVDARDPRRVAGMRPAYFVALTAATTPLPSGPCQKPTLNGMPAAERHVSFCVENPSMPAWASTLGIEATKPKQSGSM